MAEKTAQEMFESANAYYESLSQEEREKLKDDSDIMLRNSELSFLAGNLRYYCCIDMKEYDSFISYNGEYYVYLWKHIDGAPFYVGSGKNNRWLNTNPNTRSKEFLKELKRRDAIVYKVATGLTEKESRDFEFCCIHALTYQGINLAQIAWNYQRLTSEKRKKQQVEKYKRLMEETNAFYAKLAMNRMLTSDVEKYDLQAIYETYDKQSYSCVIA